MQTNTWMPVPAIAQRPGWRKVMGWYAAGWGSTAALCAVLFALTWVAPPELIGLVGRLGLVAGIVGLVVFGLRLPRRSRIALWLGAATPLVLAAAAVAYVLYSLAHSNF